MRAPDVIIALGSIWIATTALICDKGVIQSKVEVDTTTVSFPLGPGCEVMILAHNVVTGGTDSIPCPSCCTPPMCGLIVPCFLKVMDTGRYIVEYRVPSVGSTFWRDQTSPMEVLDTLLVPSAIATADTFSLSDGDTAKLNVYLKAP